MAIASVANERMTAARCRAQAKALESLAKEDHVLRASQDLFGLEESPSNPLLAVGAAAGVLKMIADQLDGKPVAVAEGDR